MTLKSFGLLLIGGTAALLITNSQLVAAPAPSLKLATPAKLRWAPPTLEKPITLVAEQGYWKRNLKPDRDYIIKLPKEKQVGGIALQGGRNVVLIGGHITVPPGAPNQSQQRAIYLKDNTGTVHIEGVNIDNSGGSQFDGIAVAAPEATIQIQNVRITGLTGNMKELHADILQPWGGAKEIRIDRLTGTSDYQGLQIPPDNAPIGRTEIRNTNLAHIKPPQGRPGFLIWLTKGNKTCNTYPMSLQNVYVEGREGETAGRSVWPPSNGGPSECMAVEKEGVVTWPKLPMIEGAVKQGKPPEGDFVPEETVGVGYVSPGYEQ